MQYGLSLIVLNQEVRMLNTKEMMEMIKDLKIKLVTQELSLIEREETLIAILALQDSLIHSLNQQVNKLEKKVS